MQKKYYDSLPINLPPEHSDPDPQTVVNQILAIIRKKYDRYDKDLSQVFKDTLNLYKGMWPEYEACQVDYHNIHHSLAVTLAAVYMVSGWNSKHTRKKISEPVFRAGICAALLHDAGYLKNKNDNQGKGGKYTFTHVERSKTLARNYLTQKGWSEENINFICRIIDMTEFGKEPDLSDFNNEEQLIMAKIVASADLIAQLADINYIRRLHDLYKEFSEGYLSEEADSLRERSIHVYGSFSEMLNNTPAFYENFILPRLQLFGRMDRYLAVYFSDGRNPYLESIRANISGHLLTNRFQWQRLGDILLEQGLVEEKTINEALSRQKKTALHPPAQQPHSDSDHHKVRAYLLNWLQSHQGGQAHLGDILVEMDAVDPRVLSTSLLSQLMPEKLTENLNRDELLALLRISLLAQNLYNDPWFFSQSLEMTSEILHAETTSLLIANKEKTNIIIALHAGPKKKELEGKHIIIDKGLSGWVFSHGHTAYVNRSNTEKNVLEKNPAGAETESILAVPLHLEGKIFGVLEVTNKKQYDFNDHDAYLLTLLSNIIAGALSLLNKLQPEQQLHS